MQVGYELLKHQRLKICTFFEAPEGAHLHIFYYFTIHLLFQHQIAAGVLAPCFAWC